VRQPLMRVRLQEAASAMAEVGLLAFARTALEVGQAVLPPYRSRFSKHQFTQPQLLAVLCLMRYEDWTFREAEVRLGEHRELRQTLGLSRVPDFTTLYRFLKRLEDLALDRAVGETVRRMRGGRRRGLRRARVAVDGTGLAQGAVSTYFVRRLHHHGQKALTVARKLHHELGKVTVGQEEVIRQLLAVVLARGHALLEGVPGIAKTLLAKALARVCRLDFQKNQCTPDLMPGDILGVNVYSAATGTFSFRRGPVFSRPAAFG
jgi:ATPase family associated with various cellular activities (AAA)/Transposase domain (DUF772)